MKDPRTLTSEDEEDEGDGVLPRALHVNWLKLKFSPKFDVFRIYSILPLFNKTYCHLLL